MGSASMNSELLIIIAIFLLAVLLALIICLVYVISAPGDELNKRRRREVNFKDGADADYGRMIHDCITKDSRNRTDTVIVSGNLRVRNSVCILRLCGKESLKEYVIPVNQYAVLGRCHESEDKNFYAVTNSPYVSRRHCMVSVIDGNLYISDYNSQNHTYVNNSEITCRTPLYNNDVLTLAGKENFCVTISYCDVGQNISLNGNLRKAW